MLLGLFRGFDFVMLGKKRRSLRTPNLVWIPAFDSEGMELNPARDTDASIVQNLNRLIWKPWIGNIRRKELALELFKLGSSGGGCFLNLFVVFRWFSHKSNRWSVWC